MHGGEERRGTGDNLAEQVEHGAIKTCVRKGRANRLDETPAEAGGVTLWWERENIWNWPRPEVGPGGGGISRQNQHHNRCLTGDPASVRRVADFDGHDATTRGEPEVVGRRALPKPWLNFKLASGLWPASRCPHQPTKTPASSLSLNRSLAPITSLATVFG